MPQKRLKREQVMHHAFGLVHVRISSVVIIDATIQLSAQLRAQGIRDMAAYAKRAFAASAGRRRPEVGSRSPTPAPYASPPLRCEVHLIPRDEKGTAL